MTVDEYQIDCLRTLPKHLTRFDELLMGLLGLGGETGECLDLYKKVLYHGHPMDEEHLIRELGDVAYYLAIAANALDIRLSDVLEKNVQKRMERYPNGFDPARSINRAEGDT